MSNPLPRGAAARLVAHRGYPRRYPENSLPGLRAAVEGGARYVEVDVQVCADGTPVLLHDASLLRTAGVRRRVCELTFERLQAIEAGEPRRFGRAFPGVRVPELSACIDLLAATPGVTAFLEIKRESLRYHGAEAVVHAVLQRIAAAANPCVIISFDEPALHLARAAGAPAIGWALPHWDSKSLAAAAELAPQYVFCRVSRLPASLPSVPWSWVVYETSDPGHAAALFERGADLVETDAIGEMMQALTGD